MMRFLAVAGNSVVNTKLPSILSHRRSTTVSLETYPFCHILNLKNSAINPLTPKIS